MNLHSVHKSIAVLRQPKKFTKLVSVGLAMAVLNLSIACSYYSVKDVPTTEETISKQISEFNTSEKYAIVHSDSLSWHLKGMIINDDKQNISGTIEAISEDHIYEKDRNEKRAHRYKKSKTDPLNEIHFYLKTPTVLKENEMVTIPLKDINRISVNDKNTGKAVANVLLTTVGVAAVTLLLVAALKSSCPFVYVKNGEEYDFTGELYPGTITPNMQEDDYLGLPSFNPENGIYTLKVANLLKEVQHTDLLQLLKVNHPDNVEVLMDNNGQLQTFKTLVYPKNASSDGDTSDLDLALKKDNKYYAFNSPKSTSNNTRSIVFEFDKPENAKEAKLYLTAKNSVWLDYIFGKFNEQFGSYYNTFQKKQQTVKKEKLRKWTNGQNIPLSVYVKSKNEWKLVERINTVGPLAMRDLVVPIQLNLSDDEVLEIKLETGFMFWEVDYVGVDFSKNLELNLEYIDPCSAFDQDNNDVTQLVNKQDGNYLTQSNIGDEVIVNFPAPVITDSLYKTTVFLKNRGYYNYIRDYDGFPDKEKLQAFKEDGAFTKFSETSYFDYINYGHNNLAQNE